MPQNVLPPSPDLKTLEPLVGTWRLSGEASGVIRFEWLEGSYFLMQHFDIVVFGRPIRGFELIGHWRGVVGEASPDICSRVYSLLDGLTLDYVYELKDGTLTIWFGEKNSENFYRGTLSDGGNVLMGGWQWPDGGYRTIAKRIS